MSAGGIIWRLTKDLSAGWRAIQPNEPVLLDYAIAVNGYHIDRTRTFVIGAPGSQPPSLLLVARTARLVANGTKSRPVVMTSSRPFGERQRGDWGGLLILGRAPINVGANSGGGTNNAMYAAIDPASGQPKANGLRDLWVTETALSTALNTAYMAENLALFGLVVGIALLLAGVGFIVLAWYALGAVRQGAAAADAAGGASAMKPATGH